MSLLLVLYLTPNSCCPPQDPKISTYMPDALAQVTHVKDTWQDENSKCSQHRTWTRPVHRNEKNLQFIATYLYLASLRRRRLL